jgi:hydroxymethylglutaryl-CoA lyase
VRLERDVLVREVGTRDGLQSLSEVLPAAVKADLVRDLAATGIRRIEAGSFVSPRAVPQMADSDAVFAQTADLVGLSREALVVDRRGAARAVESRVDAIVIVIAASESFSSANVRMTIAEALSEAGQVVRLAESGQIAVVADVATAFGCAYEGPVATESVVRVVRALAEIGIAEVTLADTTGMAAPPDVGRVVDAVRSALDDIAIGLHFHNTRGLGLANVCEGLRLGIRLFDSSLGGLGGCPYSPGATGNIATEDLVHLAEITGYATGIDLGRLIETTRALEERLGFRLPGQVLRSGPRWITKGSRV